VAWELKARLELSVHPPYLHEEASVALGRKSEAKLHMQPMMWYAQLPSSKLARESTLSALASVQPSYVHVPSPTLALEK